MKKLLNNNNELLIEEINKLKKEKNAIILAHFYQRKEVQDIADFIGDSLALAQFAYKTDADIIVLAGVVFMAETAKILNPEKTVLIPDKNATCSLAESCKYKDFKKLKEKHKDAVVVTYVNTFADVKSISDICCTSSNALKVINSIGTENEIIFGPDENLGKYIESLTNRKMILWNGRCHIHDKFSLEKIIKIKSKNENIKIISHPECRKSILIISDFVGSTSDLIKFVKKDNSKKYIVVTEPGVIFEMKKECPDKDFIPAPPDDADCNCNECEYMKMITLEKIYSSLKNEKFEIHLKKEIINKAKLPILKMLEIS